MANLNEEATWENGIYQLEETDPVQGGAEGIANRQAKQLANRTKYLKGQVETLQTNTNSSISSINSLIPSNATTTNKLITATDVSKPNLIQTIGDFSATSKGLVPSANTPYLTNKAYKGLPHDILGEQGWLGRWYGNYNWDNEVFSQTNGGNVSEIFVGAGMVFMEMLNEGMILVSMRNIGLRFDITETNHVWFNSNIGDFFSIFEIENVNDSVSNFKDFLVETCDSITIFGYSIDTGIGIEDDLQFGVHTNISLTRSNLETERYRPLNVSINGGNFMNVKINIRFQTDNSHPFILLETSMSMDFIAYLKQPQN